MSAVTPVPTPVVASTTTIKPGVKTTEFWVTMATNAVAVINMLGLWNYVPNKYSVMLMAVVNGLYAVSRGQAKSSLSASGPAAKL